MQAVRVQIGRVEALRRRLIDITLHGWLASRIVGVKLIVQIHPQRISWKHIYYGPGFTPPIGP